MGGSTTNQMMQEMTCWPLESNSKRILKDLVAKGDDPASFWDQGLFSWAFAVSFWLDGDGFNHFGGGFFHPWNDPDLMSVLILIGLKMLSSNRHLRWLDMLWLKKKSKTGICLEVVSDCFEGNNSNSKCRVCKHRCYALVFAIFCLSFRGLSRMGVGPFQLFGMGILVAPTLWLPFGEWPFCCSFRMSEDQVDEGTWQIIDHLPLKSWEFNFELTKSPSFFPQHPSFSKFRP